MSTLDASITAAQGYLPQQLDPGFYTIDDEYIRVLSDHAVERDPDLQFGELRVLGSTVTRGVGGTTPASHLSGATLTRYYPDAPSGEGGEGGVSDHGALTGLSDDDHPQYAESDHAHGGGGVTVDNTVDAPFSATTIVANGATESAPGEATLGLPTLADVLNTGFTVDGNTIEGEDEFGGGAILTLNHHGDLRGGPGTGDGEPGALTLNGGSDDNGGGAFLRSGNGETAGGVTIGAGDSTVGSGGTVELNGGAGPDDAFGASLQVTGGDAFGVGGNIIAVAGPGGLILLQQLPTEDPAVADALWNNAGVLMISEGA